MARPQRRRLGTAPPRGRGKCGTGGEMIMRRAILCLGLALLVRGPTQALDPAPPPKPLTLAWTLEQAQHRLPKVDLKDSELSWIVKWLDSSMNVPGCYLDVDVLEVKRRLDQKMTWQALDVSWIDLVARVADADDADVVISPGKVKLVPREEAEAEAVEKEKGE